MRVLMITATALTVALVLFIVGYVLVNGIPNITWELLSTKPSYLNDRVGILPDILNTIYIVIATLIVVLPLGVGAAIYLTEYAKTKNSGGDRVRRRNPFGYSVHYLRSCRYAYFCQQLRNESACRCAYAGYYELTHDNAHDAGKFKNRSAELPRGCFRSRRGKWRVIRTVVLPGCVDGIITGCILSVGRILGESAALLFTAGIAHNLNDIFTGIVSPGSTLTVALYVYAKEEGEFGVAFAIAAILLILTLLLNLAATLVGKYFEKGETHE